MIFLIFFTFSSQVDSAEKILGVWYVDISNTPYKNSNLQDLKKIKETGANYVFLVGNVYQNDYKSNGVFLPEYPEGLKRTLKLAKDAGLKVSLTVFLICKDGKWRGQIAPEDLNLWFESYQNAVLYYAKVSQEFKIDILCIGSEMESLKKENKHWENLIEKVREVYSGKIVYNTNWWSHQIFLQEIIKKMRWMKNLDYLGVSSYFELTDKNNPTLDELKKSWEENIRGQNIIKDFQEIYNKFSKEIIIWEIGYYSSDGTNTKPWDFGRANKQDVEVDEEEQTDCFSAFFENFVGLNFIRGYAIWGENVGLKISKKGYNIIGKKAEEVIRKYYKTHY